MTASPAVGRLSPEPPSTIPSLGDSPPTRSTVDVWDDSKSPRGDSIVEDTFNLSLSEDDEKTSAPSDVEQNIGIVAQTGASPSSPPFTVFSQRQRWTIVVLGSLAAIFGPISSNIYVPAIPSIVDDFHKSTQKIDLTLTIYLVFQAISPSFLAGLSDALGRRPIIIASLSLYIVSCIGIALTPSSAFWLLMVFRALQATGGSPSIATGAGCMGDIATPAERGRYVGLFQGIAMVGPAFGPVLGGILIQYLSWRWIFWILAIWCGSTVLCIFFLMPETLRGLVGNGSFPPPLLNCRPIDYVRRSARGEEIQAAQRPTKRPYRPFASWRMLLYPEILIVLAFGSFSFAVMFASLTVLSTVLSNDYHYDNVKIGLCYLPQGLGSMCIGALGGRVQDWYFARRKRQLDFRPKHPRDLEGFPIERVRFAMVPYYVPVWLAACVSYGWMLDKKVNIAGPLVVSFFIGAGTQFNTQTCQLILVDMFPSNAGASSASSNLIRCTFSAIMAAVVTPLIGAVGLGWTFVIFVSFFVAALPFLLVLFRKGPEWRKKRSNEWGHGNGR